MKGSIACVAFRPDEHQQIFSVLALAQFVCELAGRLCRLAVNLEDDIAGLNACVVGGAGRPNVLDHDSMHTVGHVELLTGLGREIAYLQTNFSAWMLIVAAVARPLQSCRGIRPP